MTIDTDATDLFALNYFDSFMKVEGGKRNLVIGKMYQGGHFEGTPALFVHGAHSTVLGVTPYGCVN